MTEAGYWAMTDEDAKGLCATCSRGGSRSSTTSGRFRGAGWEIFEDNMHRVLPEARILDMDPKHPIFHSFFEINSFDIIPQVRRSGQPILRGIFEDNDPSKRLLAIINFNTDVANSGNCQPPGSDRSMNPIRPTSLA